MERGRSEPPRTVLSRERPEAVAAARRRPMPERLELALAWNRLASQLRAGLGARGARRQG